MSQDPPTPDRGESTRELLIQAAISVFGRVGFDAASTRALAEAAGVNQALISYHFGGKEGLYLAAIEHIGQEVWARVGPRVESTETELDALEATTPLSSEDHARALGFLLRLIDGFVTLMAGDESGPWVQLILREQQAPSPAFEKLHGGFIGRVLGVLTRLVALLRELDNDSSEARLLAFTVIGQVQAFRAARASLLRQMRWSEITEARLAAIRHVIEHNVTLLMEKR